MVAQSPSCSLILLALLLAPAQLLRADDVSFRDLDKTGANLIANKELAKAEEFYRGAVEQARQKGDRAWTAEFLRRVGEVHERNQDYKGALEWYEQSLPIRQELGQKPETALLLVGTGLVKARLGDYAEAARRVESGRAIYHELGDALREANALLQLAQVTDDFDKADQQYGVLQALYEERHVTAGIAATRANHAALYFRHSQYRSALAEGVAAVDIAGAAAKDLPDGDARRVLLTTEGNAMETVGNTYQKLVQLNRALDYYQRALRIRQELNDDENAASVWTNMAPLLIRMGRTADAVTDLEQALTVRRGIGNPASIASTLMSLGEANLVLGKLGEARQKYEEALPLTAAGSGSRAVALYQLGNISLDSGRLDDALSFHQQSLDIRQKLKNQHDVVRSWSQIAMVQERRGELADAETADLLALSGFEKLTREVSDPVQLAAFRETAVLLYPNYAKVLFREGKIGEALLIVERGRGQALARTYGTDREGFLDLLTPAERASWEQATGSMAKAANRLRTAIERHASDEEQTEANAAWVDAKLGLTRTRERIFIDNPQLQSKDAASRPELKAVLEMSRRNPRTLYVEWMAIDDRSTLLFSLAAGATKGYLLPVGSGDLRKLVSEWRGALVRPDGRGFNVIAPKGAQKQSESELARRLYRAAFGPVAASLESGAWDRLVAVVDGPLLDAPLAAMVTNSGKRLVERLAVSSAISFHSLTVETGRSAASASLLVIGDPSEPGKERVVIPSGGRLKPLAQARAEANAIAAQFDGAINLTGADAREGQVKSRLNCCSILHFATHGILDADDGMDSGLLLAAEPEDSGEDGVLQAWEIADRRLNAKLAVLSACDSARGDRSLGEGLMGLAWAFQAAGTPTVVASLWNVNDAATADLMRGFYSALKSGARGDDALRQAMLKLHGQGATSSPYFWAAFSLIGQADPIQ